MKLLKPIKSKAPFFAIKKIEFRDKGKEDEKKQANKKVTTKK
jgi:hypothetical protein